jgi:DNA-directed RNA polymerase specialized sigma24 family protein
MNKKDMAADFDSAVSAYMAESCTRRKERLFAEVYRLIMDVVMISLKRFKNDRLVDRDDLVQDVAASFYTSLISGQLDTSTSLFPYILDVTRNRAIDLVRMNGRRQKMRESAQQLYSTKKDKYPEVYGKDREENGNY